ncbi:MAG: phosphoenolpyruvate carboxylase, partial [Candidatus Dormibacteraceae bacterium]
MTEPRTRPTQRTIARQEMPPQLRQDVKLLGELLGEVLTESGSPELLADVEELRHLVIAARVDAAAEEQAARLVASWTLERAEAVARAFTIYFHLVNLAEEQQRARTLRSHEWEQRGRPESLAGTVAKIRVEQGEECLGELLGRLELRPVFTAHPTEARRQVVVSALRRIRAQLDKSASRSRLIEE